MKDKIFDVIENHSIDGESGWAMVDDSRWERLSLELENLFKKEMYSMVMENWEKYRTEANNEDALFFKEWFLMQIAKG